MIDLRCGSNLDLLPTLPDCSVDACVTDPPYELGFMGKKWDASGIAYNVDLWREVLRVLKPGGHLVAFGGTRTYHRMACAIEDAGFEIRDCLAWMYGSGFPKSLDVSKAIDKAAGEQGERGPLKRGGERLARLQDGKRDGNGTWGDESGRDPFTYLPTSDAAKQWQGWGTALKPAYEPAVLARKPLTGTVAGNVLEWGTGAINVDGCRIETSDFLGGGTYGGSFSGSRAADGSLLKAIGSGDKGRWPANVLHDGSDEVLAGFPDDADGSAARFFYTAKASTWEREIGLDDMPRRSSGELVDRDDGSAGTQSPRAGAGRASQGRANVHPTVKPLDLMRWLVRLVTPPGGVVLDPFTGSGSTGMAAMLEGFGFVGFELDPLHVEIATRRIEAARSRRVIVEGGKVKPDDTSAAQMSLFDAPAAQDDLPW